jgi:secondary thiamine-phosphate synthase enzyme
MWTQKLIELKARPRGAFLITGEVETALPELKRMQRGLCSLFLQHTSASLAINENADPDVRRDLETFLNRLVPDGASYFAHDSEGPDDMPAHIKSMLIGPSLSIPVTDGRLNLGTWQGVYLCEHRNHGGPRRLVATLWGETAAGID